MFHNNIIGNHKGRMTFTKGVERIELGDIKIKRVFKYKCPLQVIDLSKTDKWEFVNGMFDADDPGKYIVEYD